MMKRSLLVFAAGITLIAILILIPLIFTQQPEGGKLTSTLVRPPTPPPTAAPSH